MEKIHGTSAHIEIRSESEILFHSGGAKHESFVKLFNPEEILRLWKEHKYDAMTIYGEAYGGNMQKMSHAYGPNLKFVAFDVKIEDNFLNVDPAHRIVNNLGLEFVDYVRIPAELELINQERDRPSVQAIRNGMGDNHLREGVVLRPIVEMYSNGERIIAKHKTDKFIETKTPREVKEDQLEVLQKAEEIADEWVTPMRLTHVLDKLPFEVAYDKIKDIVDAMVEDVIREASGEIVDSKEARKAIGNKTVNLVKIILKERNISKEKDYRKIREQKQLV